jgi:hypothetical protein
MGVMLNIGIGKHMAFKIESQVANRIVIRTFLHKL